MNEHNLNAILRCDKHMFTANVLPDACLRDVFRLRRASAICVQIGLL